MAKVRVIYAVWVAKKSDKPYLVIYDYSPFSDRGIAQRNWKKIAERLATSDELTELEGMTNRRFLMWSYADVDKLIADELKYGIVIDKSITDEMINTLKRCAFWR